MQLNIRDCQTAASHIVAERGVVFGREGSRADVTVRDKTVSNRHARLYARHGQWIIEDLGSSNGTFVDGKRISVPTALKAGQRFSLCRYAFDVLHAVGDDAPTRTSAVSVDDAGESTEVRAAAHLPITRDLAGQRKRVAAEVGPPETPHGPFAPRVMAGLAMALAYYRQTLPGLFMRPVTFVREVVGQDDLGVLGPPELVGFALPPFVVSAFAAFFGALAAAVFHRTLAAAMLLSLVVSLLVAVAICLIVGFIYHPVLAWFVRLLRGQSTPASRSHLFGMTQAAVLLGGLFSVPANVVAVAPLPFVEAVSVAVGVYTGVLTLWVAYTWYRHFQVARWFQVLILVLAAINMVSGAWGFLQVGRAGLAALAAGGEEVSTFPVAMDAAPAPATSPAPPAAAAPASVETPAAAPAVAPAVAAPPAPAASSAYEEFISKRDAIERAIDRDPTLLNRKDVLPLYKEMQRQVFHVQDKHKVKLGKNPSPEKLAEKKIADLLSDAEIYETTRYLVERLHAKIVAER